MCKFWRSEMCKSSHCNLNITIFIISRWVDLGESRSWPPPLQRSALKIWSSKNLPSKITEHIEPPPTSQTFRYPSDIPPENFSGPAHASYIQFIFCLCFFFNCHVVWLNESSFWQTSVYIRRHSSFYKEDQLHDQFIFLFLTNVTTCISSSLYIFIKQQTNKQTTNKLFPTKSLNEISSMNIKIIIYIYI